MKLDELLGSPYGLIYELIDQDTKELLELDDILVDIAATMINYRINNNLSQKELAKKLDYSQSMISKLESGDYNPTVEQLWKISKKLGLDFEIIFREKSKEISVWEQYTEDSRKESHTVDTKVGDAA